MPIKMSRGKVKRGKFVLNSNHPIVILLGFFLRFPWSPAKVFSDLSPLQPGSYDSYLLFFSCSFSHLMALYFSMEL